MGFFGNILKTALNPLSPFKAAGAALKGDPRGALAQSLGIPWSPDGRRPAMGPQVETNPEAKAMLAAMSPEDQAAVFKGAAGHGGGAGAGLNAWYEAARAAGAPAPTMPGAPPAAAAIQAMGGMSQALKPAQAVAAPAGGGPVDYKALKAKQAEQTARRAKFKQNQPPAGAPPISTPESKIDLGRMVEMGQKNGPGDWGPRPKGPRGPSNVDISRGTVPPPVMR